MPLATATVTAQLTAPGATVGDWAGTFSFRPAFPYAIADSQYALPERVEVEVSATGSFTVQVAGSDSADSPALFTWFVYSDDLTVDGSRIEFVPFSFLILAGQVCDLTDLAPVPTYSGPETFVVSLVKTINGVGPDAAGNIVVAGGTAGGTSYPIANQSSLTITHGLGRRPSVTFYDTSGAPFETDYTADSATLSATFPSPLSGSVVLI